MSINFDVQIVNAFLEFSAWPHVFLFISTTSIPMYNMVINEGPRGPVWAAGHQTDKTSRSPDPAVALVPVN